MAGELADAAAVVEVPAADRRVHGAGEDEVPGADEAVDALVVAGEDRQTDARRHVPLAHRLVDAAADDEDLLDHDARDVVLVSGQDADAVATRSLGGPQPDRVVVGSGGEDGAVLAHGHAVDRSRMIFQHVQIIRSLVQLEILRFRFICTHRLSAFAYRRSTSLLHNTRARV